jgi:hypothetical protein
VWVWNLSYFTRTVSQSILICFLFFVIITIANRRIISCVAVGVAVS